MADLYCIETYLWGWVDSELQLRFLAVVHAETLQKERCESRSSSATEGVENEESLETCALVS